MSKLVSIIMPAYNAAAYISESINSILVQTHSDWELIVVDDGSIDTTRSIVEGYCRRDSRIKYIYQTNARQGRARNNGIANSLGDYIAFLDSDDLWLPTKLAVQLQAIEAEGADMVFSSTYVFNGKMLLDDSAKSTNVVPGRYTGDTGLQMLLQYNYIPILTVLTTRKAIERAGGFTELLPIQNAEDYHLWLKMLLTGSEFVCIPGIFSAYREHEASVSGANIDRLNLNQAIEAIANLQYFHRKKHEIVRIGLTFNMKRQLNALSPNSADLPDTIKKYLQLIDAKNYNFIFIILELFKFRKISFRTLYFILNYL
jgi:teichuronic acid biosynthesis glycosyltransferase TuaG